MWFLKRWDFSYAIHLWVWIYTSSISFHTWNIEIVFQIQYEAPWKLFDTYLTGLDVASVK